jgi:hypothetical protein
VWKAALGLLVSELSRIDIVPVRSLLTKKIAPPPSLAWLSSNTLPPIVSVIRLPSL